jgi:hypothetical protein
VLVAAHLCGGCTIHHSRQALPPHPQQDFAPPSDDARFVTEEDSGLAILGLFQLAEPDHYAVLLDRVKEQSSCGRMLYPQLDFYTDFWLLVSFPISRITLLCEPEAGSPSNPIVPKKATQSAREHH